MAHDDERAARLANLGRHAPDRLPSGWESKVYRVRAPAVVHERLRRLGSDRLGEVLSRAVGVQDAWVDDW